jgi:type IV pilus assembly protein PilX
MFKYAKMTRYAGGLAPQRGSALIVALVFLLAMTLIGTTAMQGTTQQERMAGNYWDRNLAFQAAEAALSVGGRSLELPGAAPPPPSTSSTPAWQQDASWWNNDANSTEGPPYQGLSSRPRYVVQNLGTSSGGGVEFAAATSFICQVVARATGGSDNALVILAESRECG